MKARTLVAVALACAAVAPSALAAEFSFAPNDRITSDIADGRLTPRRPPAAEYGDTTSKCPSQLPQQAAVEMLGEMSRKERKPVPPTDARLCAIAEAFLAWDAKDPPSPAISAFVAHYFGLPAFTVRVVIIPVADDDPKVVGDAAAEAIANFAFGGGKVRYGMMYQRLRKKNLRVAVALAEEMPLELSAPRRLDKGQVGKVKGKLLDDHDAPMVLISDPRGKLTSFEGKGTTFEADLPCGDVPGLLRVEIRAQLGGSPVLLTRFPVACGVPLETSVSIAPPEPWAGDLPAQARKMFEVINAERTSAGLKPVLWDDALSRVATGVADQLKAQAAQGIYDPPRDLTDRLKKEGIASSLVMQNSGRARSAQEGMAQMTGSPTHRATYLEPTVTHAGVGLASGTDGNVTLLYVDQIFIKELPHLDPATTAEKLRAAVIQKRKDGRFPAAAPDAELDAFAQTYAKEVAAAGGRLSNERHSALTFALNKRFKKVSLISGAKQDPLDFAEEPEVTAAGKVFGVGVALGMHEKLGRNAVYAVVVVGEERGGKEEAPAKKGKKK